MKVFSVFAPAIYAQAINDSEATGILAAELDLCNVHNHHEQDCLDGIRDALSTAYSIEVTCAFTDDWVNVAYEGYWYSTEEGYGGVLCGESSIDVDSAGLATSCDHASHGCMSLQSGEEYNRCMAGHLKKNGAHFLCSGSRDMNILASDPAYMTTSGTGAETVECGNAYVSAWCIHR